jgi:tRNA threonylcarbamoyladenosine biosynthesis protein TsaB
MLLLVVDTSGKQGFVALVRAEEARMENSGEVHTIESVPLEGGTFSAQLVPQIAGLLAKHGFGKTDVDAFIVISGPGSFTGLRVGLAAIKALAEILGKPIVAVSLLEVIALASGKQGKIFAALDAGRNEVYAGEYEVEGENARCIAERLLSCSEFLAAARGTVISTPHEALLNLAQDAGPSAVLIASPDAAAIGRCGERKLRAGETVAADQLEANYIRRSDAEIFAKPGIGS